MSFDEHDNPGCWVCGSVLDVCQCDCDHEWLRDCCVYCAKEREPVEAETEMAS